MSPLPPTDPLHVGAARIGPLMALPGLLAEMGVAPRRAFARARVGRRLFDDPENFLDYASGGRLLATCVELTGCAHFALLVGARATLADFGLVGRQMRHSPTVGEALRVLLLQMYLYDSIAVPVLLREPPAKVLLGYSATLNEMQAVDQVHDVAIAVAFKLLRELAGPAWKPQDVHFAHRAPSDVSAYRRLFGCPVHFDRESSGLVFAESWLARPIDSADPKACQQARLELEQALGGQRLRFDHQVERVLHQMLLATCPTSDEVARLFAISPRSLRLRLAASGTGFQPLLDKVRFALAGQLMRHTGLSLAEVAAALHYADPAVFSRAFRKWAGSGPRQWRQAADRGATAVGG